VEAEDLYRWMSRFMPVRVAQVEGLHGPLEVRWERGRKVLNSAQANQSFGRLHNVWQLVLKAQDLDRAGSALILGLGGGSALHILRNELGLAMPATAVELDPVVVHVAREHFGLDRHANVDLIVGDAIIHIQAMRQRFDLVLVDLFDDLDLARGVDTRGFAHGLRERCAEGGTVCFNTVAYDDTSEARCDRVLAHLRRVFLTVDEMRTEGVNRVFIARG